MEYVIVVATREMVENIIENEEVIYIVNDLLKLKLQTGGHKAKLKKGFVTVTKLYRSIRGCRDPIT